MKKIIAALAIVVASTLSLAAPAQAQTGGNFQCSAGSRQIPGNVKFCAQTQWHTSPDHPGKVKMDWIEFWIAGDASQLEGGSCGSNPAANYNPRLEGPSGDVKWNPAANCLTQATGYSDVWSTSLDGVGWISPNSVVISSFTLRDNGGTDSTGSLRFTVD